MVIAVGVLIVARSIFDHLMLAGGISADEERAMFDHGVADVFVLAAATALLVSVALSLLLARQLARPLNEVAEAAGRIASGDLTATVPRHQPAEIASLADSFNVMARSLARQQRAREELVGNIAHEIRTPLTNLKGYLEAMRDGVVNATPEQLRSLHEEVERLVRLSRALDTLAEDRTQDRARCRDVDISVALRRAVELARPGFDAKRIRLELELPTVLRAHTEPDHLAQVLGNLLQNALRYTPAGGRVGVVAKPQDGAVLVAVSNSGDGIPAEELSRVFDRFYRVEKSRDSSRGGAGIGLAIVKELVESVGGEVGADSRRGETRFWLRLPQTPVPVKRSPTARPPLVPSLPDAAVTAVGIQGRRNR